MKHPFVKSLNALFLRHTNVAYAVGMKAYMLNQFEFFGIKSAPRRKLDKDFAKANPIASQDELITIVKALYALPQREFHYCAIELIAFHKKLWDENIISLFEYCITHNSWWDTVDHLASECFPTYFNTFSKQIKPVTQYWNKSDNIWLQRSSIMFQKSFKSKTDIALLKKYILHCAHSKEFFVQKAIGWALREYAKTNPTWVIEFVKLHENILPALSKREALKHHQ